MRGLSVPVSSLCFDSILVRLKGNRCVVIGKHMLSFDSILVRLKACLQSSTIMHSAEFRFHTGSIKSPWERENLLAETFLFHTGSIKRPDDCRDSYHVEVSFYSILVRLKVSQRKHTETFN